LQLLEQLPEGVASMAQLPLPAGRKLRGGQADRWDEEERIIAEAILSTWGFKDLSFHGSVGMKEDLTIASKCQGTDEASRAVCYAGEKRKQQVVVALVFRSASWLEAGVIGEAGRADARSPVQGVDLQAGVVGEDELTGGMQRVGAGLEFSIA